LLIVPEVAKIKVSGVVDRDVLPIVEHRTGDRKGGAGDAFAVDGVKDLLLRSTSHAVSDRASNKTSRRVLPLLWAMPVLVRAKPNNCPW
jgi:hypothetical protein